MKKILLLCLLPILSVAQTQIGIDINGETEDWSGYAVSLSADGNVVAIGAVGNDENGVNSGLVRVYQNNAGNWTQIGTDINGESAGDGSGYAVSLSADGNVLAIGAIGNAGNGVDAGHVRVYQNNVGVWTQIGTDIDGEAVNDVSGWSVSLSADGTVVAIGAIGNAGNGAGAGHVRVYQNIAGNWTQIGMDIDGEAAGDLSGWRVSFSADGNVLAIGAIDNAGNGADSGHVRVYQNIAGTWTQIGSDIDGEAAGDRSSWSVSLSADGTVVAIGAYLNDENGVDAGHVRVYKNIVGTWTQIGSDIDGEAADGSGFAVSLSANGTVVAIGAVGNGVGAGHVRVYQNIAGAWTQIGTDIDGEAANDKSGYAVSLSADGTMVAIGAYLNDGNGNNAGHVRVYDLSAVLSSDQFVQTNFKLYPNPTANYVTIQLNGGLQLEKVNVYSTSGQLITTELNSEISVNDLAKGSYLFEVITKLGKATKTIVVK